MNTVFIANEPAGGRAVAVPEVGRMNKILLAKDAAEKALSAELCRTGAQRQDAWKFAAGTIIVLAFQLLDLRALVESPSPWVKVLCCLSLAVLGIALFLAVQALQTNGSGHYPRGQKLWETLKPETVSEAAAAEALVQMLLQTREQNARLNDATTRRLKWCGWLFLAGALLVAGTQLLDAFENWT